VHAMWWVEYVLNAIVASRILENQGIVRQKTEDGRRSFEFLVLSFELAV